MLFLSKAALGLWQTNRKEKHILKAVVGRLALEAVGSVLGIEGEERVAGPIARSSSCRLARTRTTAAIAPGNARALTERPFIFVSAVRRRW